MNNKLGIIHIFYVLVFFFACSSGPKPLDTILQSPPESTKPWVYWYWMHAAYSREGITADLEAMKEAGIGGAYLMPIKGVTDPPLFEPVVEQLSPEWWKMVRFALEEADRLGLQIAMHGSDGFSLAGGPWITPELSMQKVVWTDTIVAGKGKFTGKLTQPERNEGYYRDIAVFAFPAPSGSGQSTNHIKPKITTSVPNAEVGFLTDENSTSRFRSDDPCWILYEFDRPFTCRSITIRTSGNNYQSHRLLVETSNDGKTFTPGTQLEPPRHGWQDAGIDATQAIPATTARYFRFVYDPEGSVPGAEDLDAAKWRPSLRISKIELSSTPRLHHFEGKSGQVWRVSSRTNEKQLPGSICIPMDNIVDITKHIDSEGYLIWDVPAGEWTILRIGHTSTGHTNATGGAGKGLECDKFNPEAIKMQFESWFGEAVKTAGPELTAQVLSIFHLDSWECGSQNWSPVFRDEFQKRRGYDLYPFLPVMAGIPVESADISERFLYDVRQTISELIVDNFFGTMTEMASKHGCSFSAECVAPTMVSDGMMHYKMVDIPMGEFWLRSPTHDKPNDILDAVSGAHIYGKPVVKAEAFTQLRMAWDEHPAMLKALGDRHFTLGINKFSFHVFTHNPWMDRFPGMTLDGVGLYFQRDQTWWKPGKAWVDYITRCQALLQQGRHVADIAVFTGEEIPRRAILPDRLVNTLPGIFGEKVVEKEKTRMANAGQPLREMPDGVMHSANMTRPGDWLDPLRGYKYDSFNKDALLNLAVVKNGRIELPGGASYGLLVLPQAHSMSPGNDRWSPEMAERVLELVKEGATIVITDRPNASPGLKNHYESNDIVNAVADELWGGNFIDIQDEKNGTLSVKKLGKGQVVKGPVYASSFKGLGIGPDVIITDAEGKQTGDIAWTHRTGNGFDIYFISNQVDEQKGLNLSIRQSGKKPELYNPVTGILYDAGQWQFQNGRTELPLLLEPNGSMFVIFRTSTKEKSKNAGKNWPEYENIMQLNDSWGISFDPQKGGPEETLKVENLFDWGIHPEFNIRHYSGTATYSQKFEWKQSLDANVRFRLDLGEVANIAQVTLNGFNCGVAWTPPYQVDVTSALKAGENELIIEVTNTWANRLIGDWLVPENERITWTTAPYRLERKPLLKAGLLGPVIIKLEE